MDVIQGILDGCYHKGGIKSLDLGKIDNFDKIKNDCMDIVKTTNSSNVTDKAHRTYWTNPIGDAKQWSLWNKHGFFDDNDALTLDSEQLQERKFHHDERFPNLANLLNDFPNKVSARINSLGPKSSLSKHEENIIHSVNGNFILRARFHIPIVTDENCLVYLDGDFQHFKEGNLYFFNNGCVHSALNTGNIEKRLHLVLDTIITTPILEKLKNGKSVPTVGFEPVGEDYPRAKRLKKKFQKEDIEVI